MWRRGYVASAWVGAVDSVVVLPDRARTPQVLAAHMKAAALERLERLTLGPAEFSVIKAITIGQRQNFDPALREAYSLSGAAHLLSVSGLHVGIVAMLANMFLSFLPALRRGHRIRNIAVVAMVWLYAMMTGLSAPALRAAMMFTGVQFAYFSSRRHEGMNGLLATATVMLLLNPNYLYDMSFQLSFAAVMGIFVMYRPLMAMVRSRWRALNAVWSVVMIGIAASVAIAPLVAYHFGYVSIIGIFLNPAVIITANIILMLGVAWIIAPVAWLNGIVSFTLNSAAWVQNTLVEFSASVWWASLRVDFALWQVLASYLLFAAIYWVVQRYFTPRKKNVFG
jgi:competence protein ComEC